MAKNSAGVELNTGVAPIISTLEAANTTLDAGVSATFRPNTDGTKPHGGRFSFEATGTFVGTVVVERSLDNGTTWIAAKDRFGTAVSLTAPGHFILEEREKGAAFRAHVTAYTSGSIVTRLSQ